MKTHDLEAHPPLCLAARDRGKKSQIPWLPWRIFLLWPWGPLGYIVILLFWEASIWKVVNPQNWSINSLSTRAVHDVMMWNINSKIKKHDTVLTHTTDHPDLASSFFSLFRLMMDGRCGQHFPVNCAIIAAVKQWAASIGASIYKHEVKAPVHCW